MNTDMTDAYVDDVLAIVEEWGREEPISPHHVQDAAQRLVLAVFRATRTPLNAMELTARATETLLGNRDEMARRGVVLCLD